MSSQTFGSKNVCGEQCKIKMQIFPVTDWLADKVFHGLWPRTSSLSYRTETTLSTSYWWTFVGKPRYYPLLPIELHFLSSISTSKEIDYAKIFSPKKEAQVRNAFLKMKMKIMKMKMKMKNRSNMYDMNRLSSRHKHKYSKNKKYFSMITLKCIKQHINKFEAKFMKTLYNAKAELKKSVFYTKTCIHKRIFKLFLQHW